MEHRQSGTPASSSGIMKHLLCGALISAVLVYFAARGVSFGDVATALRNADFFWVACSVAAMLLMQALRSFRWSLLLRPLARIDQLTMFSVTSVGFLAIVSLPMRLGEIVRPYIMAKRCEVEVSSALSSVVAERVFDAISVIIFVAMIPFLLPSVPNWLYDYSIVFFALILAGVILLLLIVFREETVLSVVGKISIGRGKYAERAASVIRDFIAGMKFIKDWRLTLAVFVISVLVWFSELLVLYYVLLAFKVALPFAAYLLLTAVLLVAIAIPAAPGFIGSWHYACVLGLSFFGVAGDIAFAFGALYHFITMGLLVTLGLIFLPGNYSAIKVAWNSRTKKEN